MFEQIVRPFQSRPVTSTRRVVPSVSAGSDTGLAVLTWGEAGVIKKGAKQDDGVDLATVGFTINCCDDTWEQKGDPVTDPTHTPIVNSDDGRQVGTAEWNRVREISFENKKNGLCGSDFTSYSYAALPSRKASPAWRRRYQAPINATRHSS